MKKIEYHVAFLSLALSVACAFAGDAGAPPLRLSPTKIPKCAKAYVCQDLQYGGRQVGKGAVHANVAQTHDHCHPNDYGFIFMGRVYAEKIVSILKGRCR